MVIPADKPVLPNSSVTGPLAEVKAEIKRRYAFIEGREIPRSGTSFLLVPVTVISGPDLNKLMSSLAADTSPRLRSARRRRTLVTVSRS